MNSRIAAAVVGTFVFWGAPAFAADNMSSGSMSGPAPKDISVSSDNMSSGSMASDKGMMGGHAAKPKHKKKSTASAMKGGDSMHDANTMGTGSGASDNAMGTGH